jgi:hypothetical protein
MVGVGVGTAAAAAIEPLVEPGKQQAWSNAANKLLDAGLYARLVAQGAMDLDKVGRPLAARHGFNTDQFDRMVYLAQEAPDLALTLELWRRGQFGDPKKAPAIALVDHALAKAQIERQYWTPIKELFGERLAPPVIALAIVRGIMKDPGFLPVGPPTSEGKVKAFPVSGIDTLEEARAHGFDFDRLFVETAIAGRPMGPESAASAVFRDILLKVDYDRAIAEGDVRNEWADAIFETARQIPSVANYVTAHLKAWIDEAEMNAGVARHGMSKEDAHLLYLAAGRPAAPGQMATAAARGIDGPDGVPMNRAQFLKGIAESDIRPEWGPMLWDARYLYPPLFQLTRLVQAGAITADEAADWARKDRYPPEVVTALHAYWTTLTDGEPQDPRVKLATSQAIAALKRQFMLEQTDEQGVTNGLQTVGVSAASADQILNLWTYERLWTEKPLTPANVKKAYKAGDFPIDEAIARLVAQQWSSADANTYLTT